MNVILYVVYVLCRICFWTNNVPYQFHGEIYGNHKYSVLRKWSQKLPKVNTVSAGGGAAAWPGLEVATVTTWCPPVRCCPPSPRSAAQTALPGRRADPCHHGGPRAASTEPRTHTHSRQSRFWWGPGNLTATLPVQNEGKLAKMNQMVSEWILLKVHKVGRGFRPLVSCASFGWHLTVSVTNKVQIVKGRLSRGVVKVLGERNSKHSK